MEIAKVRGKRESKNRPVATNFQFLKILAPLGQLLVGACLPQTLLETSTANWRLSFVFHIAKSKNNANSYNYCCDD